MAIVAPSILSADFSRLKEEILKMEKAGAQVLHLDVMDGKFVPAKTFGPELVGEIHAIHSMVNDVHLMVADPGKQIPLFLRAGADSITFHYEACADAEEIHALLSLIHQAGKQASLSIKPATPVEALFPFWAELDMVLIMSVEPGKGGQKYMDVASLKLRECAKKNASSLHQVALEVDGGINASTAPLAVSSGAQILVAGSYLYGHEDYAERVKGLLEL